MQPESFEQVQAEAVAHGRRAEKWLKGEEQCVVTLRNGTPIAVQPPNFVELKITETDPGVRGDTSGGGGKPATPGNRRGGTGAAVRRPGRGDPRGYPSRANTSRASSSRCTTWAWSVVITPWRPSPRLLDCKMIEPSPRSAPRTVASPPGGTGLFALSHSRSRSAVTQSVPQSCDLLIEAGFVVPIERACGGCWKTTPWRCATASSCAILPAGRSGARALPRRRDGVASGRGADSRPGQRPYPAIR